jgi:esterase/lipase superfamily enzyme
MRDAVRIAYLARTFALLLLGIVHASALEVELVHPAAVDDATKALIERFRQDPGLAAAGITVRTTQMPVTDLRKVLEVEPLRIALVSLDFLLRSGIVQEAALAEAVTQPAQFPNTAGLFGVQDAALGEAALAQIGKVRWLLPITYWSRGQTAILSRAARFRTAADFRGRQIATAFPTRSAFAALDASWRLAVLPDLAPMVLAGAVDAVEIPTVWANQILNQGPGLSSASMRFRPLMGFLVVGSDAWEQLNERPRMLIARAARAADETAQQVSLNIERQFEARAIAAGMEVVDFPTTAAESFIAVNLRAMGDRPGGSLVLEQVRANRLFAVPGERAPAPQRRPPGPPSKIPVLFATDRGEEPEKAPEFRFGSRTVEVPTIKCGTVEHDSDPTRKLGDSYDGRLALAPNSFPTGEKACADFVAAKVKDHRHYRLLLFVHGFKNSFEDAVRRAITMAQDIKFDGIVLVWSWPSDGSLTAYMRDEEISQRTKRYFAPFVRALLARPEIAQLDVVAHSMGNRVALELLEKLSAANERQRIGSVVFAAPDVDKPNFGDVIRAMSNQPPVAYHRTIYAARYDRALQVSAWLHGNNRVGQGGDRFISVLKNVDSIDASEVEAGYFKSWLTQSHAHVFEVPQAIDDLRMLLMEKKAARERSLLERKILPGTYWIIKP